MLIESQLKRLGFGTAAIFLLIVAVLINVPQMYLMTTVVGLIPVVGWLANKFLNRGLVVTRKAPGTANQRSRQPVELVVENNSKIPKFFLRFNDSLPRQIRYGGTHSDSPSFIPVLWPGEKASIRYFIEPVARGAHNVGPLTVLSTDVLGFTSIRTKVKSTSEVLVYPEVLPVSPVLMSTGSAVGLRDDQDARSKGSGTDFAGVREYRAGDELRRINWKSTARTGSLVVTEFSQGFASDITIVFDRNIQTYQNSGRDEVSAFEYAVKIAVAFGVTALSRGSRVTLVGCGEKDELHDCVLKLSGIEGVASLLETMARAEPLTTKSLDDLLSVDTGNDLDGAGAIVITAHKSDDDNLRTLLLNKFARKTISGLQVFWLDSDAFRDVDKKMNAGTITRSAYTPTAPGISQTTNLGREFTVGPDTNLIALLGGLAHGN